MKLVEEKLILNEEELKLVKQANMMASPSIAGVFLQSSFKHKNLTESLETNDLNFFIKCILAFRKKEYEVKYNIYKKNPKL